MKCGEITTKIGKTEKEIIISIVIVYKSKTVSKNFLFCANK
jgi:hypothetical protein